MGTRADFYLKEQDKLTWLGSVAWDGYPDGIDKELLLAKTQVEFSERLAKFMQPRDDETKPEDGWPWPWEDSSTTDYAYAFDVERGGVLVSDGDNNWRAVPKVLPKELNETEWEVVGKAKFPDMTSIQKVDFGKRSGIIVIGGK